MAYNQSKIKMFRRCQRQFAFRYDTNPKKGELVPRTPALPLHRGTWMHALQEAYHRELAGIEGPESDWKVVHARFEEAYDALFDEEKVEYGDLPRECKRMFKGYLRRYGGTDADSYRVATVRGERDLPACELVIEVPLDEFGIALPFKGRIDLLLEDLEYGGLWIRDAKWVKTIPNTDDRMMSPQALMYPWALWELGYDVRGFIYDYGRTEPPSIPRVLQRPAGMLSVAHKMDTDYYTYMAAIKRQHPDPKERKRYVNSYYKEKLEECKAREATFFRRERVPTDPERVQFALREFVTTVRDIERRSKEYPPRNWMRSCRWDCSYLDLCVGEFTGLDIKPLIKKRYTYEEERYSGEESNLVYS